MIAWYLVIFLSILDGVLCHELMKAWDELDKNNSDKNGGNSV